MHLVEDEVEDEGEEVEQPARPQHPPRDPGRDEAGLSSIVTGLGDIQTRPGVVGDSLLINLLQKDNHSSVLTQICLILHKL